MFVCPSVSPVTQERVSSSRCFYIVMLFNMLLIIFVCVWEAPPCFGGADPLLTPSPLASVSPSAAAAAACYAVSEVSSCRCRLPHPSV